MSVFMGIQAVAYSIKFVHKPEILTEIAVKKKIALSLL